MYARSFFTHKQLHGKKKQAVHDMLHSIGKSWTTDLTQMEKNGTYLINTCHVIERRHDILPTYQSVNRVIGELI